MHKIIMAISVLAAVLLLEGTGWSQCAMCRTALENSPEGQAIAQGFRQGIIFLLAAPYVIMGGISYGLVKAYKKQQAPPKG
jgi:hypothetical protein